MAKTTQLPRANWHTFHSVRRENTLMYIVHKYQNILQRRITQKRQEKNPFNKNNTAF